MRSRYVPQQIDALIHSEHAGKILQLWEIDCPSGTKYWAQSAYTWRGQAYAAIIKSRENVVSSLNGQEDECSLTVLNMDGTVRDLIGNREFEAAEARLRLVCDGLASSSTPALTGGGTGSLTVTTVKPKQLDGLWTFTKRNGLTTWDVTFVASADGLLSAQTNTATTAVAYTSDDGNLVCTINAGTYPDGSVWKFRTINNFLYWVGVAKSPEEVGRRLAVIPLEGLVERLRVDAPRRQYVAACPWVFGTVATGLGITSPCGYTGPTTTANGAGVSSVTLTPTSMTDLGNTKGRTIKIGSGSPVKVTAVGTTTLTLESARSWSNGDNIVLQDCRKTFADCQDANREFEFGGFRAMNTVKAILQRGNTNAGLRGNQNPTNPAWKEAIGPEASKNNRQHGFRQGLAALPVPQTEDAVPLVYGRRLVPGVPVEFTTFEDSGGFVWRVVFYALSGGPLENAFGSASGPVDKLWVAGRERKHRRKGTSPNQYLLNGFFERLGVAAVDDTETEAEYGNDSDTVVRAQNKDYETATGTAYNRIAYAMYRAPATADMWRDDPSAPDCTARVQAGRIVQKYNADGSASSSSAFSDNPVWALLDFLTDKVHGAGLPLSRFALDRAKEAADYAAIVIPSVEADTKVTTGATSAVQVVANTAGFRRYQKVYKNGVDTGKLVQEIDSATQLTLDGSITTATGDSLQQYNPRFQCDLRVAERRTAYEHVPSFLNGCRGFIAAVDGKIVIEIDRPTYAAALNADPGLEVWTSASNLTNYAETTTGGSTVAQEATIKYAGTYSAKLTKAGGGYASIATSVTLQRGKRYTVSVRARASQASTSIGVEVYNVTDSLQLQSDYTWVNAVAVFPAKLPDTSGFHLVPFTFTVDPHSSSATPTVSIGVRTHSDVPDGQSVYLDEFYVDGPLGGEFTDLDVGPSPQRSLIVGGASSFELAPNDSSDVNEVQVSIRTEFQGQSKDETIRWPDETHQATNPHKELTLDAPSLATADQAVRIAKWTLGRCRTLGPGALYKSFLAGLALAPGDIVRITHRQPNWTQRLARITKLSILPRLQALIEAEHYDATIYADAGEPSEPGVGFGLPTVTLTLDAAKRRKLDLSWTISVASSPVRFYEVFVSLSTIDATDPEMDALQRAHWTRRNFAYQIPHANRGLLHYARVVAVLADGREVVSNQVSGTESTTLDDENDGASRTLVREVPNMILDGDFSRDTKWTKNAHGSTVCQVNADRAELNATSHSGSLLPTIFRNIPKDSPPANKRLAPLNSWMTWAMSAKYPGSAATADLLFIFFTGAEVGDGSESNYKLIYGFPSGSMTTSWKRASDSFQWGVAEPALPGGGNNNRAGVRTASTNTVYADKIALYHGLIDKDGLIFAQTAEDENAGFYPDFSDNAVGGGGANSGGGLGNCVLAGEPVWINGSIHPIGSAKAGDRIVAWRGGTLAATVLGVRRALARDLVEVQFVRGGSQICTARHRFAREPENGEQEDRPAWTAAEDLEPGARLLRASPLVLSGRLDPVRVKAVRRLTVEHEVVNVQVAATHNFLLARHDLLCHNVKMVGD